MATNWRVFIPTPFKDYIDVYVFEPGQKSLDFAVPYCNYYMLYSGSDDEVKYLRKFFENAPYPDAGIKIRCLYADCSIEFNLLTDIDEFKCPTCRRVIIRTV